MTAQNLTDQKQPQEAMLTIREQLIRELEHTPDELIEQLLDFCLFINQRQLAKIQANDVSEITPLQKKTGLLAILDSVKEIHAQVPSKEWDKLPHDGSINHDHYLYGGSKIEE